jgi:carbon-monoxide dehydrogenase large subunit
VDAVDILLGDTDVVAAGGGSHSGRSMRHAATVFSIAAKELIENGRQIAAWVLEAAVEEVEFRNGRFAARGAGRSFGFLDLAREADAGMLPKELKRGLAVVADNEMHDPVFPNGCAVCECEVDPETGWVDITRYAAVDDVGRCINPLIVHGQTHGGIAQGIGQALWESCHMDPESGQLLAGSLMDYGLPRADALPAFRCEIVEVLSPTNPFGIKAGGEGGTTPALAAVVNAIVDALREYGVEDISMPTTPEKIWRAMHNARL